MTCVKEGADNVKKESGPMLRKETRDAKEAF